MTSQRRPRAWADILVNQASSSGSAGTPVDLLVDLPTMTRTTVARIIGDFMAFPDDRNATSDAVMQIDMGIGVASQEAFTAQIVPDPNVQAEYPALGWLYATTQMVLFNNSSGTTEAIVVPVWHFDIRANRKVDKGVLYMTWNNTAADGTGFTVRLVGRLRSLCLN